MSDTLRLMHWRLDLMSPYPACGANVSLAESTSCMAEVDCSLCQATIQAYLETLKRSTENYPGAPTAWC